MSTYNAEKAFEAQMEYCDKNNLPLFAPRRFCFKCSRDIYDEGGISVEEAGKALITYCPHCHKSFID